MKSGTCLTVVVDSHCVEDNAGVGVDCVFLVVVVGLDIASVLVNSDGI